MIISRTPLRISFVGGGTDLPAFCDEERGVCVSTAIKKYVYIVIHPSFEEKNLLSYSKIEKVKDINEIENTRIKEVMKLTGVNGLEIHSIAEVPSGTGLGGSSSFTVGLLNALYSYKGKYSSKKDLAIQASNIEIENLGEKIGRQDQFAASYGGINKLEFFGKEVVITPILLKEETKKELEKRLLLFYLGSQREANEILKKQSSNLNENPLLKEDYKKMRDLADKTAEALQNNNLEHFGKFLDENWELKKKLSSGITNAKIDKYYELAKKAGAIGGKLLGAGGSGFLLIYVNPDKKEQVKQALKDLKEEEILFDTEGSKIIYSE